MILVIIKIICINFMKSFNNKTSHYEVSIDK